MDISVIIPHYNSYDSLAELLQTIPNSIEVIVVDDNSSDEDKLLNVIDKYNNVKLVKSIGVNLGGGNARNRGLEVASRKWVLFADADDYFTENAFDFFNDYIESEYDCIYFNVTSVIHGTGEKSKRHLAYSTLVENEVSDIRYKHYVPWGKLISLNLIKDNNIVFDEVVASNDIVFTLNVGIHSKKIKCDKRIIYCVTDSSSSLVKNINKKTIESRFLAALRYNKILRKYNINNCNISVLIYLKQSVKMGFKFSLHLIYIYIKMFIDGRKG